MSCSQALGWAGPLDTRTLAVQLREVAKSYTDFAQKLPCTVSDGASTLEEMTRQHGVELKKGEEGDVEGDESSNLRKKIIDDMNEDEAENKEGKLHGEQMADSTSTAVSTLLEAREIITTLVPQLYQKLNAVCGGGVGQGKDAVLIRELQGQPWIWVGDSFVLCSRVAYVSSVNATPYLHQLPQDLRVYSKLLGSFSIKKDFSSRDYIQVLREMYDASALPLTQTLSIQSTTPSSSTTSTSTSSHVKGTVNNADVVTSSTLSAQSVGAEAVCVLSESKIDLAVSLVTLLSAEGGINPDVLTIYAPDSTGRLAHSTSLINDDVPWLSGPECGASRVGCRFIHPNISSLVAKKLGETVGFI